jgi:DNA-binding response OmpR family regulator
METTGAESTMSERSLLVVEDDADLAELVALNLQDTGYGVSVEHHGTAAMERIDRQRFDLVILDLNLPGVDGLEICRHLRSLSPYTAILMLTARTDELDRVLGLEVGADDYLTKPFSVRELLARVKALLRRMEAFAAARENGDAERPLVVGDLELSPAERTVHIAGSAVELTAREFELLHHFARHPGRVFTRAQLLDSVWGYAHDGYEHTVNTHINRLRAKIEADPSNPRFILTVWGVGYKFPRSEELV